MATSSAKQRETASKRLFRQERLQVLLHLEPVQAAARPMSIPLDAIFRGKTCPRAHGPCRGPPLESEQRLRRYEEARKGATQLKIHCRQPILRRNPFFEGSLPM